MAVRFAGDFFGVPLVNPQESEGSKLLSYFPELKNPKKATGSKEGARSAGDQKAVTPFVGYKTFEAPENQAEAIPLFSGFKTVRGGRE
jgi:hypothetical protein